MGWSSEQEHGILDYAASRPYGARGSHSYLIMFSRYPKLHKSYSNVVGVLTCSAMEGLFSPLVETIVIRGARCDVESEDKVRDSRHAIPPHSGYTLAQLSSYVQTVYQREAVAWHTA